MNVADHPGAGCKKDGAGNWSHEALDQVIDMVDQWDLVREKFDHTEHHQQNDDPLIGQRVPGRFQLDQVREASQQGHDQQRDVSVQACACGKSEPGKNSRNPIHDRGILTPHHSSHLMGVRFRLGFSNVKPSTIFFFVIFSLLVSSCSAAPLASVFSVTPSPTSFIPKTETLPTQTSIPVSTLSPEIIFDDFPEGVDPLTGLQVADPAILDRRPVAVKISNYPRSVRPQWGLSLADIVYEYYHNNDLTRFYAIFYGQDAKMAGPIRSGRLFDSYLTDIYQDILVFASADYRVLNRLNAEHPAWQLVPLLDGVCPANPVCRIDPDTDNFLVTDTSVVGKFAEARGGDNERQDLHGMAFSAAVPDGGEEAEQIDLDYSYASYSYWKYDPNSGRYQRYQDTQDAVGSRAQLYAPLIDQLTGQQVAADNVVVLFIDHFHNFYSSATEIKPIVEIVDMDFSGHALAYAFRDGKAYSLEWVREQGQLVYLVDSEGKRFPFKPGTTWFQVVTDETRLTSDDAAWRFEFIFRRP